MTAPPNRGTPQSGDAGSTTEQAKQEGRQVADHARQEGQQVADTARQEAGRVADEAKVQARQVADEARQELQAQAEDQTQRASGVVDQLGNRLDALAEGRPEEAGPVGDYVQSLAEQAHRVAGDIEQLGFQGVMDETQRFARRRPGAFLLGAAAAGFAVSRLARGAQDAQQGSRPRSRDDQASGQRRRVDAPDAARRVPAETRDVRPAPASGVPVDPRTSRGEVGR